MAPTKSSIGSKGKLRTAKKASPKKTVRPGKKAPVRKAAQAARKKSPPILKRKAVKRKKGKTQTKERRRRVARPPSRSRREKRAALGPKHDFVQTLARIAIFAVLLVLAANLTSAFSKSFFTTKSMGLWRTPSFYYFCLGGILFPITYWGFTRPLTYLYVLGHELTHVVFVKVFRGEVDPEIFVSADGGYIKASKANLWITLSPYLIPFYTITVLIAATLIGLLIDLNQPVGFLPPHFTYQNLLSLAVGFTWVMHFLFTVWMITKDQPDLQFNGTAFSLVVIYLANLLIIAIFFIIASPKESFASFGKSVIENLRYCWAEGFEILFRLIHRSNSA